MPATAAQRTETSLYVHVPFCAVKCGYCDFNSYVVQEQEALDAYLAALEAELALTTLPGAPSSVFLGGGTPSLLDPRRLQRLFEVLARHVDLPACAEVSMEANPESITAEKASIARAAGVRRFSMGVQSFDDRWLRFLDRPHDAARARQAAAELRSAGVDNLGIDLIYGIPGQTVADWGDDLEQALALGPDHLSCYNLTYEPGTRLHRDLAQGRIARNDEEDDRTMFLRTRAVLAAAGFEPYEISNFAGRGGPCRHNDHYWLQGDYVGVGPGANSHRGGVRIANLKPLDAWVRSALAGIPPAASAETLTPRQRAGEAVWLGVRRRDGVDMAEIEERVGFPLRRECGAVVEAQELAGWIECAGTRIRLTPAGVLMADAVGGAYLSEAG
jgi:oxygen-independent coproporphyrinogen-3 oxidase